MSDYTKNVKHKQIRLMYLTLYMLDAEFAGRLIVTIYSLPEQCYFLVSLVCMLRVDLNHLQKFKKFSLHSFSPSALVDFRKEKEDNVCVQVILLTRTSCSA